MPDSFEEELKRATDNIVASDHPKKLIVAGPGTGKTFLFQRLLEKATGQSQPRLVVTFINNLKDDLESALSGLAEVYTFHGYCHRLLRQHRELRQGLSNDFQYLPGIASLIKNDWEFIKDEESPHFIGRMRKLEHGSEIDFYLERADYYDAVEFDDSVYRAHMGFARVPTTIPAYNPILVDEYQDFNALEVAIIDQLASKSPIVIAGDDDQALYAQLKGASHEFIRSIHNGGQYERWELPFCLRCPQPVVEAITDVFQKAADSGNLPGRISKPYRYYPPKKAEDSKKYPKLRVVECSVQRLNANYFGKYVAQQIRNIPNDEILESRKDNFPTVLVIGPSHYLKQIASHLEAEGFILDSKADAGSGDIKRDDGIRFLKGNPDSNLGWRIMLACDKPKWGKKVIKKSASLQPLHELVPEKYKKETVAEVAGWEESVKPVPEVPAVDQDAPRIKLTSFEGSKGLSAQHVFIVGLQEEELPRDAGNVEDIEICKFIVALTRTRKQCHLIHTRNFGGKWRSPSAFIDWISDSRKESITVNAEYWN